MSKNTWPNGHRHAMDQSEHEAWNARNYPGTRQMCDRCDEPTGRCEDDMIWSETEEDCALCESCRDEERDTINRERWASLTDAQREAEIRNATRMA